MRTEGLRIDKWLWHARFYRTRGLAQQAAFHGVLRVNGNRVEKPGAVVRPGDIVTMPRGQRDVVVVRVLALGLRRGPASEAQTLYQILEGADV